MTKYDVSIVVILVHWVFCVCYVLDDPTLCAGFKINTRVVWECGVVFLCIEVKLR